MKSHCFLLILSVLISFKVQSQGIGLVYSDTLDTKGLSAEEVIRIADKALALHYEDYKTDLQYMDNSSLILNHRVKVTGVVNGTMLNEWHTYRLRVEVAGSHCIVTMDNVSSDRGVTPSRDMASSAAQEVKSSRRKEFMNQMVATVYDQLEGEFTMARNVVAIEIERATKQVKTN